MSAWVARHRGKDDNRKGFLGFTLVELLVVVVIIAVLAAIAIPIFLNQKKKAEEAAAKSSVAAIADILAVAHATGGTLAVTEAEVVGTDGAGGTTRLIIPSEYGTRIMVGTRKGVGITDGTTFSDGTWCVSVTNPAGGVIQMTNGATEPNMAGNACYPEPSLNTSVANGGSGAVSGPPTAVVATAGDADASVSWSAPSSDGGNTITNYVVESNPSGMTCIATAPATTCVVTGLTNNTGYTFTVKANNSMGASAASDPSNSVTPLLSLFVPDAPTSVIVDTGDRNALISWTEPSFDGNTPVTGYTAVSSPAGKTCTTTSTSCTVTGLTNGTAYTFTVKATNSQGDSDPSAPSDSATPSAAPGSPLNVAGVSGNGQITVSWDVPADDGATPITGYTVTRSPGGNTYTTTGATSKVITGLTNGTVYTFTVTATNSRGTGPASDPSAGITPATVPNAPTGASGTRGNGQITVTWSAPANDGGATITGYTVMSTPENKTCSWSSGPLTCTVTGLANNTSYSFTVKATNSAGTSTASSPTASVATFAVPDAPTGVSGTAGNSQVTVSWTAPSDNGGSAITGYTVTGSPSGTCTTSGATTCTVTGLANNTGYTFTVRAANAVGTGTASVASSAVTPIPPFNAASGGTANTITNYNGTGETWKVHTFTSVGANTFTITSADRTFNVLLVAGGGGGGRTGDGGGGGAGGMLVKNSQTISAGTYTVNVGAGGAARTSDYGDDSPWYGKPSSFNGWTALGGGIGGWGPHPAGAGGSGGGTVGGGCGTCGAAGTPGQGYNGAGGGGGYVGGYVSGGGGGAGGPGLWGTTWTQANGGPGASSSITGSAYTYSAGGCGTYYPHAYGSPVGSAYGNGGNAGGMTKGEGNQGIVVIAYRVG